MTGTAIQSAPAHAGYSIETLEALCRLQGSFDSRVLPWAMWESEHTGYGRAFRTIARYPRVLPLFFGCDHGVMLGARCWDNETRSPYPGYFTWLGRKRDTMRAQFGKRAHHIAHPWTWYRKMRHAALPADRRGTLVFYPHSNGTSTHVFDVAQYIADLKALPERFQPVVVCLSFHDVVTEHVHRELQQYDIPVVTAGHGSSQHFIDRFYTLLYQFRYATSPNIGSHTFYIMEAGVPFFLFGPYPKIAIKGSKYVEDGLYGNEILGDEADMRRLDEFTALLYEQHDAIPAEQRRHVEHYLGLDAPATRADVTRAVWREALSLRNWWTYLSVLPARLRRALA